MPFKVFDDNVAAETAELEEAVAATRALPVAGRLSICFRCRTALYTCRGCGTRLCGHRAFELVGETAVCSPCVRGGAR